MSRLRSGIESTEAALAAQQWAGNPARVSQAMSFIKRAKKSDKRRKMEKASRKRNRR